MLFIITIGLLIIAFMSKAFMDISAKDGWDHSWWNKTESWENKYASPLEKGNNWWYFGLFKPKYKEKFPFSSTALVFLSDGWHLLQFFFLNTFTIALAINMGDTIESQIAFFCCIKLIYAVVFNTFYK